MKKPAKSFTDNPQYGIRAIANSIPAGMCIAESKPCSLPVDHPYKSAPPAPDAAEARIDVELRRDGILK